MCVGLKKTAGMGSACAWKHRFFCPFLGSSFGQAKEEQKEQKEAQNHSGPAMTFLFFKPR
jgi:hypothetical protein